VGAKGVGEGVVEVEVPQYEVRVGKGGKNTIGGNRAVGRVGGWCDEDIVK